MDWQTIRKQHPNQWLVVEAENAHTDLDGKRLVDRLTIVEQCGDGGSAFSSYRSHHKAHPEREYYFVHTSRPSLVIEEEKWLGVRVTSGA